METKRAERAAKRFFEKRFPNKILENEKACGYFYEWVHRFKTGSWRHCADSESFPICERIVNG